MSISKLLLADAVDTATTDSDVTDRNHRDFPHRKVAPGVYRA
jgi:hypothetical protein